MKMSVVVVGDDVEQETVLYEVSLHVGCVKKKKKQEVREQNFLCFLLIS